MSGVVLLESQSISAVIDKFIPVLSNDVFPATDCKCRSVDEVYIGTTLTELASFPVAVCQLPKVA